MAFTLNPDLRSRLSYVFCLLLVVGLFMTHYFRALPSICIIALAVLAIWHKIAVRGKWSWRSMAPFIAIALIFVLHLLSLLVTEPHNYGLFKKELVIKSPLVVLSLAFAFLPAITRKGYLTLYYLFTILTGVAALISLGFYLAAIEETHELYLHSKVMFTVVNYVRFSLLIAFAVVIAAVLYHKKFFLWNLAVERKLQLGLGIGLYIFMHVLAVRSGMAAFYGLAGLYAAYLFFFKKEFKKALAIALILVLSPIISFYTFQTYRNKFHNTVEDVGRVDDTRNANNFSLVGRVYSYKTAFEVVKNNPVFGTGISDLKEEIDKIYARDYPNILPQEYKMPHNQYLYYLAAFGFVGLAFFLACFYYPFLRYFRNLDPLFLAHYFIISVSFMFEFTLETQMGITFTLFFLLLPLYFYRSEAMINESMIE